MANYNCFSRSPYNLFFGDYEFIVQNNLKKEKYIWYADFYALSLDKNVTFKYNEEFGEVDVSQFTNIIFSSSYDQNFIKVKQDVENYFKQQI